MVYYALHMVDQGEVKTTKEASTSHGSETGERGGGETFDDVASNKGRNKAIKISR